MESKLKTNWDEIENLFFKRHQLYDQYISESSEYFNKITMAETSCEIDLSEDIIKKYSEQLCRIDTEIFHILLSSIENKENHEKFVMEWQLDGVSTISTSLSEYLTTKPLVPEYYFQGGTTYPDDSYFGKRVNFHAGTYDTFMKFLSNLEHQNHKMKETIIRWINLMDEVADVDKFADQSNRRLRAEFSNFPKSQYFELINLVKSELNKDEDSAEIAHNILWKLDSKISELRQENC